MKDFQLVTFLQEKLVSKHNLPPCLVIPFRGGEPTSEIWEKRTDNMKGVDNKTFTCASPREGIGSLLNYNKNPRL
jgi:hypothetical protein